MSLLEHNNASSLCRTCLEVLNMEYSDSNPKHNIFQTPELAKKLIACTAINVEPSDKYPKYLCNLCYSKVNEFHKFRTMCIESMERLRKLYLTCDDEEPLFDLNSVKMEIEIGEPEVMVENDAANVDKCTGTRMQEDGLASDIDLTDTGMRTRSRAKMEKVEVEHEMQAVSENDQEQEKKCVGEYLIIVELSDYVETDSSDLHCNEVEKWLLVRKDEQPVINKSKDSRQPKTRNLRCDICSARFRTERRLEAHRRAHDAKICDICGKVCKSALELKKHHYTHKYKKLPFQCHLENCSLRFLNRERLTEHLLRHAGIQNYVCSFCGIQKTTLKELEIHINFHQPERQCQLCPRICSTAEKLSLHVRTVHEGIKNYACRYCDRKFGTWITRKFHEMTHTGERPHKCEQCGKSFIQLGGLKTHLKIHMRDSVRLGL